MATRGVFTPVFEETESVIQARMIALLEAGGWRTEKGDFPYDAVAPSALEVKALQRMMDYILSSRFARYAGGTELDDSLYEIGLTRIAASPNRRTISVEADAGVTIPAGNLLFAVVLDNNGEPLSYTVDTAVTFTIAGIQAIAVTAVTHGTIGNLATGAEFVLQPTIPGVKTLTDLGATVVARDVETDDDAWARYDFRVNHPDTGGNQNDYIRWSMEVGGVGKAKVIPLWAGLCTVKVLLVGNDFTPASPTVVSDVQAYLDPGSTGLGAGKAPIAHQVTVAPASALAVNISITGLTLLVGAVAADVREAFLSSVRLYLRGLVFEVEGANPAPVIYNRIAGLLTFTPGVNNFTAVTVNGGTIDLSPTTDQAPTLGTVTGI